MGGAAMGAVTRIPLLLTVLAPDLVPAHPQRAAVAAAGEHEIQHPQRDGEQQRAHPEAHRLGPEQERGPLRAPPPQGAAGSTGSNVQRPPASTPGGAPPRARLRPSSPSIRQLTSAGARRAGRGVPAAAPAPRWTGTNRGGKPGDRRASAAPPSAGAQARASRVSAWWSAAANRRLRGRAAWRSRRGAPSVATASPAAAPALPPASTRLPEKSRLRGTCPRSRACRSRRGVGSSVRSPLTGRAPPASARLRREHQPQHPVRDERRARARARRPRRGCGPA